MIDRVKARTVSPNTQTGRVRFHQDFERNWIGRARRIGAPLKCIPKLLQNRAGCEESFASGVCFQITGEFFLLVQILDEPRIVGFFLPVPKFLAQFALELR